MHACVYVWMCACMYVCTWNIVKRIALCVSRKWIEVSRWGRQRVGIYLKSVNETGCGLRCAQTCPRCAQMRLAVSRPDVAHMCSRCVPDVWLGCPGGVFGVPRRGPRNGPFWGPINGVCGPTKRRLLATYTKQSTKNRSNRGLPPSPNPSPTHRF